LSRTSDHYALLGLRAGASPDAIKSAYRKIALKHHPDRSKMPESVDIFRRATEAYEILNDPERREDYDRQLATERRLREEARHMTSAPRPTQGSSGRRPPSSQVVHQVAQMTACFRRGQVGAAEELAYAILEVDRRQAVVYGVLGDIARGRARFEEAAKMYAYAAQMEPRHTEYERRHVEMIQAMREGSVAAKQAPGCGAFGFNLTVVGLCGAYLAFARERPLFPSVSLISSLTLGLVLMALLCGIALGVSLGLDGLIDRFSTTAFDSTGRVGPAVALGVVSLVSFWAAAALYVVAGATQRSFQYSASRLVAATAAVASFFGLCGMISPSLNPTQAFFWSGNLVYLGALAGWFVADAFRAL
jgi:hypothetical protein